MDIRKSTTRKIMDQLCTVRVWNNGDMCMYDKKAVIEVNGRFYCKHHAEQELKELQAFHSRVILAVNQE